MVLRVNNLVGLWGGTSIAGQLAWSTTAKDTNMLLSNSNRTVVNNNASPGSWGDVATATGKTGSGKWYAEITMDNFRSGAVLGLALSVSQTFPLNAGPSSGGFSGDYGGFNINTAVTSLNIGGGISAGTSPSWMGTYADGDIFGVALDLTNGRIWIAKNNNYGGGDPATNTTPMYTGLSAANTYYIYGILFNDADNPQFTINSTLTYAPPTGYIQWT